MRLYLQSEVGILLSAVSLLACSGTLMAKDKPRIEIKVVDAKRSERLISYTVPGTAADSTTNCNSHATATDLGGGMATANGTTSCETTTRPGMPPITRQAYVQHV